MRNRRYFLKTFDFLVRLLIRVLPKKGVLSTDVKCVLVIKLAAMGDALNLIPSIRLMSEAGIKVDWLTTSRCNPSIFMQSGLFGKIITLSPSILSAGCFAFFNFFRLREYDAIIDYDQYYGSSELLAYCGRFSVGFRTRLKGTTFSMSEQYDIVANEKRIFFRLTQRFLRLAGVSSTGSFSPGVGELLKGFVPTYDLRAAIDAVRSERLPVVVIYPGSSENAKFRRWPAKSYISLVEKLSDEYTVVIAGGPDEKTLSNEFSHVEFNWIGRWDILSWLWILSELRPIVVANDGGFLHLAETQEVRIIGIFGPSLASKWGSAQKHSEHLEGVLPCRPCLRNYQGEIPQKCRFGPEPRCLNLITVNEVRDAVSRVNV